MIIGMHAIIYSREADRLREFINDILELDSVDAGGGWPIFAAPPTELAVHPTDDAPEHELYLMCDDIEAVVKKLAQRDIATTSIEDRGWGLLTTVELPGGESIGLYEPRHPSPLRRPKRTAARKRRKAAAPKRKAGSKRRGKASGARAPRKKRTSPTRKKRRR